MFFPISLTTENWDANPLRFIHDNVCRTTLCLHNAAITLLRQNLYKIWDWEGMRSFWIELKSCSPWSIGITVPRSITQSSVLRNNISIAMIKCTHGNRKTKGGGPSQAKFYYLRCNQSTEKEKSKFGEYLIHMCRWKYYLGIIYLIPIGNLLKK